MKETENELVDEKKRSSVHEESQQETRWKQLYNLEKLKKDQTIKKLDEMVQLMATKGLIASATNHNNISESKMIKKLQMELRNEKIKYEKLLSEKQSMIMDHNQNTQKLETKLQTLQDERDQLKIFANASKLKDYKCDSSLTVSSNRLTSSRKSYPSSFNLDQELSAPDDKMNNVNQSRSVINPTHQPMISSKSNSNVHFEGVISLIPFTKAKRSNRKVVWKKYYAVLTLNELLIFSDKSDKSNSSKAFQKIETRCLKSVSKTSHRDLTKADVKDLPRVFMIRYFDQDIANVTEIVKQMNRQSLNNSVNLDPNDKSIKRFKGHSLIISKVDNQPFCGACSSNLGENRQGGKLVYCYECKKCALKFHAFHINTSDSTVTYCSHDSPSTDDVMEMENSNFFMNMFLMAPSIEEQFKWIYNFNRVIKMSRSIFHCKTNSNSDHESGGGTPVYREKSPNNKL